MKKGTKAEKKTYEREIDIKGNQEIEREREREIWISKSIITYFQMLTKPEIFFIFTFSRQNK